MKANLCIITVFMLAILAGCGNNEPGQVVKLTNPTCEDLGKITDPVEHAELFKKCPDYLRGGAKKSPPREW